MFSHFLFAIFVRKLLNLTASDINVRYYRNEDDGNKKKWLKTLRLLKSKVWRG